MLRTSGKAILKSIAAELTNEVKMRFEKFSFGSVQIDGVTHENDVVIDPWSLSDFGEGARWLPVPAIWGAHPLPDRRSEIALAADDADYTDFRGSGKNNPRRSAPRTTACSRGAILISDDVGDGCCCGTARSLDTEPHFAVWLNHRRHIDYGNGFVIHENVKILPVIIHFKTIGYVRIKRSIGRAFSALTSPFLL